MALKKLIGILVIATTLSLILPVYFQSSSAITISFSFQLICVNAAPGCPNPAGGKPAAPCDNPPNGAAAIIEVPPNFNIVQDSNSFLRVKITNQASATLDSVQFYDWIGPDGLYATIPYTGPAAVPALCATDGNWYTNWGIPPAGPNDITYLFAVATLTGPQGPPSYKIINGGPAGLGGDGTWVNILRSIPNGVIPNKIGIEFNGVSGSYQWGNGVTIYTDPTASFQPNYYPGYGLQSGWSLNIPSVTVSPGQIVPLYFVVNAPTPGTIIFSVTAVTSETGYTVTTGYLNFTMPSGGGGGTTGGVVVPIDKLALFAPYVGLASLVAGAIALTLVYLKREGRKYENDN